MGPHQGECIRVSWRLVQRGHGGPLPLITLRGQRRSPVKATSWWLMCSEPRRVQTCLEKIYSKLKGPVGEMLWHLVGRMYIAQKVQKVMQWVTAAMQGAD